jgi:hypothetical protein
VGGEAVVSGPDAWGARVTTSRGTALDLANTVNGLLRHGEPNDGASR